MKLLLIGREILEETSHLLNASKTHFEHSDSGTYNDLTFVFKDGEPPLVTFKDSLITEFTHVYFHTVGGYLEHATLLASHCIDNNIKIFDKVFHFNQPWIDRKSFEYIQLTRKNIPIINSHFVSAQNFEQVSHELTFPLIAKLTQVNKGDGVFLCSNQNELVKLFKKHNQLLLQPFISNSGDLRVLVIGNKVVASIHRQAPKGEYRNNVAQGGITSAYSPSTELTELAIAGAQALNYQFAGVDCIRNENGKWLVMEVNRSPQFLGLMKATNIDVPNILMEYLSSQ